MRMENVVRMRVLPSCLCQRKLQRLGDREEGMKGEMQREAWLERMKSTDEVRGRGLMT